jgi:tRNA(Phe) wybutosine-synthesizing methylase Tyw3
MDIAFMEVLREFGIMVALVVFFTWQGWKRETRMSERISLLEEDYTSTLKELVANCTEVISANTAIMQRLEKQLDKSSRSPKE